MWRRIHSVLGLASLVLVVLLSLTGAILSVVPVVDRLSAAVQPSGGLTVADVLSRMDLTGLEVDTLTRAPSGAIRATYLDPSGASVESYVDVQSGAFIGPVAKPNGLMLAIKDFHRSLFLQNTGRYITGLTALTLAVLSLAGVIVLIARMGGVARLFDRMKGRPSVRWHNALSRLVLIPLLVTTLSGFYIMLTSLALVPLTRLETVTFPQSTQGLPAVSPGTLRGLADIPLDSLRKLQFPLASDPLDVFTATTSTGLTLIDRFTGAVLEFVPATSSMQIQDWMYALHTGEGLASIGAILGLAALTFPLIGVTGVFIWWRRRRDDNPRIAHNAPASSASIVLLVGSEGGSTWGFARSLHASLTSAGHAVHMAPMNAFGPTYAKATQVIFLAATYGNGTAPTSANLFLDRLANLAEKPKWAYSVLGFGDRAFPNYCQFAKDVDDALTRQGARQGLETTLINRQSPQAFATWGIGLAAKLGTPMTLDHQIELPPTHELTLVSRSLYGEEVQAPTAVLLFRRAAPQHLSFWQLLFAKNDKSSFYEPGDLLGVLPSGSMVPRYYSVSSEASDDLVEICVRKQIGGECSGMLHDMPIGGTIACFVKQNPEFKPVAGRKPVIMISAGTGIAPFISMIRSNRSHRDFHLFWGGRSPTSDFLYQDVLTDCQADRRLASLTTAFSRVQDRAFVQDAVRTKDDTLRELIRTGASVMVCGGDAMARAVAAEVNSILAPAGSGTKQLKMRGLYQEDIF